MDSARTPRQRRRFARIALGHVTREYPHKLDHVLDGDGGRCCRRARCIRSSSAASTGTAASTVTGLLTLRRLYPDMAEARRIARLADTSFTAEKVAAELRLSRPTAVRRGFERPYGWAWLLMLHAEAPRHDDADGAPSSRRWRSRSPIAFKAYLAEAHLSRSAPARIQHAPSRWCSRSTGRRRTIPASPT